MQESKLSLCLTAIVESGAEFILVGGLAAVLQRALITRFGPLDLLAAIGDGLTYHDLLAHSRPMLITEAVYVKVLELDEIIAIKEKLGTEKDSAALPILRRTARELKRAKS